MRTITCDERWEFPGERRSPFAPAKESAQGRWRVRPWRIYRSFSAARRCSFITFPTVPITVAWSLRPLPLVAMNTMDLFSDPHPAMWIFNDQGS
jgi:hypothetical protein